MTEFAKERIGISKEKIQELATWAFVNMKELNLYIDILYSKRREQESEIENIRQEVCKLKQETRSLSHIAAGMAILAGLLTVGFAIMYVMKY